MTRRTYNKNLTHKDELPANGIFVFGSNTEGRHGMGSALVAKDIFGAVYGKAEGLQGRSYGLITTDLPSKKMGKRYAREEIVNNIFSLYKFAHANPHFDFYIPYEPSVQNLNGYDSKELAEMFIEAAYFQNVNNIPKNIIFKESFWNLISEINTNQIKHLEVSRSNLKSRTFDLMTVSMNGKAVKKFSGNITEVYAYAKVFWPEYVIKGIGENDE